MTYKAVIALKEVQYQNFISSTYALSPISYTAMARYVSGVEIVVISLFDEVRFIDGIWLLYTSREL